MLPEPLGATPGFGVCADPCFLITSVMKWLMWLNQSYNVKHIQSIMDRIIVKYIIGAKKKKKASISYLILIWPNPPSSVFLCL